MRCHRVLVAIVFALWWAAPHADAASITFDSFVANQGDTFPIDIRVDGVTDLYSFSVDVLYNPAIVGVVGVSEGSFLAAAGPTFFVAGDSTTTPGLISLIIGSLVGPGSGVTGSGGLAQIMFSALAPGNATLALANAILLDSQGNAIDAAIDNRGGVTVRQSTVPEPATLTLFGLGLLGLARRSR